MERNVNVSGDWGILSGILFIISYALLDNTANHYLQLAGAIGIAIAVFIPMMTLTAGTSMLVTFGPYVDWPVKVIKSLIVSIVGAGLNYIIMSRLIPTGFNFANVDIASSALIFIVSLILGVITALM